MAGVGVVAAVTAIRLPQLRCRGHPVLLALPMLLTYRRSRFTAPLHTDPGRRCGTTLTAAHQMLAAPTRLCLNAADGVDVFLPAHPVEEAGDVGAHLLTQSVSEYERKQDAKYAVSLTSSQYTPDRWPLIHVLPPRVNTRLTV